MKHLYIQLQIVLMFPKRKVKSLEKAFKKWFPLQSQYNYWIFENGRLVSFLSLTFFQLLWSNTCSLTWCWHLSNVPSYYWHNHITCLLSTQTILKPLFPSASLSLPLLFTLSISLSLFSKAHNNFKTKNIWHHLSGKNWKEGAEF